MTNYESFLKTYLKVTWFWLALTVGYLANTGCKSVTVRIEDIQNKVGNELPLGSDKTQVLAFLDSNKIEHWNYEEGEDPLSISGVEPRRPGLQRYIYAVMRDVEKRMFTRFDIHLIFYFDESAKLTYFRAHKIGTGL